MIHVDGPLISSLEFPGSKATKSLPASAGDAIGRVQSLSWEDPLEKGLVTHSTINAWKIPWTEEPGSLQSMGSQRVRQD